MGKAEHFSLSDEDILGLCLSRCKGVRFVPSDAEIFELLRTKNGDPSSVQYVKEIDLLKHEPWELPGLSLLQHFFYAPEPYEKRKCSRRKRNGESCKQHCFKRSTKSRSGYWDQGGSEKPISGFGVRRTLRFYRNNPGSKRKKDDITDYMIYEYEPVDFDFKENPFVVLCLERNPGHKCTSKCEAGSSKLLACNALPQLPNAPEGEFSTVGGQADLHQSASDFGSHDSLIEVMKNLPPIISDFGTEVGDAFGPQVDPWPLVNSETQAGGGANSIAPLSDINSCVSIGGIDAILTGNTNTIDSCVSIGGIDAILTVPLPPHVSVPVVQESSVDNHTSLSDQVYLSQHSTSIFDTEVRDAFGPQVDPRLVVESETQAGGGARPPPDDQEYTGNTYPEANYEWVDGLFDF